MGHHFRMYLLVASVAFGRERYGFKLNCHKLIFVEECQNSSPLLEDLYKDRFKAVILTAGKREYFR